MGVCCHEAAALFQLKVNYCTHSVKQARVVRSISVVLNLAFVVSPNKARVEAPQRDPSLPGEAKSVGPAGEAGWASTPQPASGGSAG